MAQTITIPLINPNEPEAVVAALLVTEGQAVKKGDVLCILETTKSTLDLMAESDGFVSGIRIKDGDTVKAGEVFGFLAESRDWRQSELQGSAENKTETSTSLPAGLRISQPALDFAQAHGLDLEAFPRDIFITLDWLQVRTDFRPGGEARLEAQKLDPSAILIYGAGGHGKSVLDLLRVTGTYQVKGFVDDGVKEGESVMGLPVLGGWEILPGLYDRGIRMAVNAVGGIGNIGIRENVFNRLLLAGFGCPTLVHPRAFVEASAAISAGAQIFPLAYVGSEVRVGFGAIVNTAAVVSHECVLGDLVNIAPQAVLAGGVSVGARALIGMGATVNLSVTIGEGARIGNGATVKTDVPPHGVVPAGTTWPR